MEDLLRLGFLILLGLAAAAIVIYLPSILIGLPAMGIRKIYRSLKGDKLTTRRKHGR